MASSYQFKPDTPVQEHTIANTKQTAQLRLFAAISLLATESDKRVLVTLQSNSEKRPELSGSSVYSPGNLYMNQPNARFIDLPPDFPTETKREVMAAIGYYTQVLTVEMWFNEASMALQDSFPKEVDASGSSSVSDSLSAGFFGLDPQGTLSVTNSSSRVTTDFTLNDRTDLANNRIHHEYRMTKGKDGALCESKEDMIISSPLGGQLLHGAPQLATDDFPFVGMGVWKTDDAGLATAHLNVRVSVNAVLVNTSALAVGAFGVDMAHLNFNTSYDEKNLIWTEKVEVPFNKIAW